jgi:hypothetical protein
VLQKSQKALRRISHQGQNKRQLPINEASNPLSESPASLSRGKAVPHIVIRSSGLRLGEFESHAVKRLCNTIDERISDARTQKSPGSYPGLRSSRALSVLIKSEPGSNLLF